ncbi:hypothetical protein nvc2_050 [Namao virus]|nr:hypothetical protein nvc2_050 [Namao virus]
MSRTIAYCMMETKTYTDYFSDDKSTLDLYCDGPHMTVKSPKTRTNITFFPYSPLVNLVIYTGSVYVNKTKCLYVVDLKHNVFFLLNGEMYQADRTIEQMMNNDVITVCKRHYTVGFYRTGKLRNLYSSVRSYDCLLNIDAFFKLRGFYIVNAINIFNCSQR